MLAKADYFYEDKYESKNEVDGSKKASLEAEVYDLRDWKKILDR